MAAAYGWPEEIPEDEALARLFELNQERARGGRRRGTGIEPSLLNKVRQTIRLMRSVISALFQRPIANRINIIGSC